MMRQRRGSINFCRRGKEIGGETEIGGGTEISGGTDAAGAGGRLW